MRIRYNEEIQQKEQTRQELRKAVDSHKVSFRGELRWAGKGQHGSPVSGHFPYCLRTLALCVLTVLRTSSSGGQWEDLHRTDPLHWEKTFWGHKANQSSGKGCSGSSRKALEETGVINWFTEVERHRARAVVTHRRSHPFPSGDRILTLKITFTNFY